MALCLIVGLFPTVTLAIDDENWAEAVTDAPNGYMTDGSGNVTISDAEGLAWFAKQVNAGDTFAGKTISLTKDIDLSAHEWVPIGTQACPFSGIFNGGDHEISGMRITVSETNTTAGLFGRVSNAVIQNVTVTGATISGTVMGEERPSTNAERFTGVYIGGIAAALKEMASAASNTATIEDCHVELAVDIETNNGVIASIGGILGWTDEWSGSKAIISASSADVTVIHSAPTGFYRSAIGGAIGEMNTKRGTTSSVSESSFSLKATLIGDGAMANSDGNDSIAIGGVSGYTPGAMTSVQSGYTISLDKVSCQVEADLSKTTGLLPSVADIGGVFGRGTRYQVEDVFSQIELIGNETEKPYHFGNLAGYTYNDEISCKRVYTYGLRHQGAFTYLNECLSYESNGGVMPNYPLTDVYYIQPQTLTENVAGVPFLYKSFHTSHTETPGLNDGFVYSDGDSSDAIIVTPSSDGKQVSVTPSSDACAVHGEMTFNSGASIKFTLPIVVESADAPTKYQITTVKEGRYQGTVETLPADESLAGEYVTIRTTSNYGVLDSLTVVTDGGENIPVTRTDGTEHLGNRTYQFIMPEDNVTVTAAFREKKKEITVLPGNSLDFGTVYEGYQDPAAKTVTLSNTGETWVDVTLGGTISDYIIEPQGTGWTTTSSGQNKIRIEVGETATFTIKPKTGLSSGTHNGKINLQYLYQYIDLKFKVSSIPEHGITTSPTSLDFGVLASDYTQPTGKEVTITNVGKQDITVDLPTSRYFDIVPGTDWSNGQIILAPQRATTVTVAPKVGLHADTYQETLTFTTDYAEVTAQVTASVQVDGPVTYTITATAGPNGTISPVGDVEVTAGNDQTFVFTPAIGYEVSDVLVDGSSVGKKESHKFSNVTSAHTIEVRFEPIQYSITYDLDGGSVALPNPDRYTIETPTFTLTDPTRSGHTFLGWTKAGENIPSTSVTITTGTTGDLCFTAHWRENSSGTTDPTPSEYTLRYETNGGKKIDSETYKKAWTKDYDELPVPVRNGYVFEGWYRNSSLTMPVTGDVYVNSGVVTLFAKWSEDDGLTPDDTGVSRWLNTEDHFAYLQGMPNNSFGPGQNITRAEVAQMFYNLLLNKNVPTTVSFTDVAADAWYADAVNALASMGILNGVGGGKFDPTRNITRAEFTAIAMRFADLDTDSFNPFSDINANDWFYEEVVGAVQYGWIKGFTDGTFRPYLSITRAEVTVITNRMLGRSADQAYVDKHSDELRQFSDVGTDNWAYYDIAEATNSHDYAKSGSGERWTDLW